MTSVVWSPQSVRDFEAIRAYISEESPRYAELVVGGLLASVERLPDGRRAADPELMS